MESLARDPEAAQKVMQEAVMGTTVHSKIANAAGDIQKKYEAILKLEESVNELFKLFEDLAMMIQEQGEMLDNIESNLADANDYMERAETHLKDA